MNLKVKMKVCTFATIAAIAISIPKTVYAWDSKNDVNVMDTHKTISVQALQMIKNDMCGDANVAKNLSILESNINQYKIGSIIPDYGEVGVDRDYNLYQDHFYDPDTGKNFTSNALYPGYLIPDTAESQVRNYYGQALANWKDGNYSRASFLLGKAMHYFADANEPHHVLNWTGGPGTAHTGFESYIESIKDEFKINTIGTDKSEYTVFNDKPINEFLTLQTNKYAKMAKSLAPKVSMQNTYQDWHEAGSISMKNAQTSVASLVYRFLKEVTYETNTPLTTPVGKFFVVINTVDEQYAGTNDYVYFGMEFNDGQKIEFNCDLPGDDFCRKSTGSYQFEINNPSLDPSKVTKVWLRKSNYLAGDDWKVKNMELYLQGRRVVKQDINQWLHGNASYEINVAGLK